MTETLEKTEKNPTPMLAIDGSRVRQLREEKKLTQLYVASVVGVTTDTISRWENNRYPSIKRENAEKLAIALEVELADLLRGEEQAEAPAMAPVAEPAKRSLPLVLAIAALVAFLAVVGYLVLRAPLPASAVRILPKYGAPGSVVPVQLKLTLSETGTQGVIVREKLPAGWRLLKSIPHSSGEEGGSEAKWLIPAGSGQVTISYAAQAPPQASLDTRAEFSGELIVSGEGEGRTTPIGGDARVTVAPCHWADKNGDGRIDDTEIMPAYYLTDELKGLELDWPTIEAIWSGKGYRWGGRKGFEVIK